jgi:hypothetical protein
VKAVSETEGKKEKIFFYKVAITVGLLVVKTQNIQRQKISFFSYLNSRQKFGYADSSEMCYLQEM